MTPHMAFPQVSLEALAAELAREAEARAAFYPGRVAKGNMLQAEADRELAIAGAWQEDLRRIRSCWFERPGEPPAPAMHGLAWRDRRAALLRELDLRRRIYPEWIAGGRMLEAQAAHRIACLACLLAIYEDGWDWRASDGATPATSATAAQEFHALRADVDAREGKAQHALAL